MRWAESISALAVTGLGFSENLYERERYEEILKVAAEIRVASNGDGEGYVSADIDPDALYGMWISRVGSGVQGYVTPKVSVAAVVRNDAKEILLIQRGDSGVWLYPTGWADVGYSPSEVVVKEVREETGVAVDVVGVLAVLDGMRSGFTSIPMYSIVFLCQYRSGEIDRHPLETRDAGWFSLDALPSPIPDIKKRVPGLTEAVELGKVVKTYFDPVREEM
ncbi:ADP-ribose pyrophosphatase YjhB, NUDIX family [Ferrithrix thermotolerans DSM 19514]|uniref:ADP-ribose pyrophosphatase YjhB, NUDIX family n=2 Tax=Ferrithrix TaxID=643949 RepID=A0A1M4XQA3_9ACTN|nr:ADP-ribose pyrophosphatase YjhB, NUDIX family [Ferrithrix thermotolerans DSM 19514]